MEVSKEEVHVIMDMAEDCWSGELLQYKGVELLKRIVKEFPELQEEYSWVQKL